MPFEKYSVKAWTNKHPMLKIPSSVLGVVWKNMIWFFFGFTLSISGITRIVDPSQFVPMIILNNLSILLIQIYGVFIATGGALIIIGLLTRAVTPYKAFLVETAGYWFILPAIMLAFFVFALTGAWNRLEITVTYFLFGLVIVSRLAELRRDYIAIKSAERAIEILKDISPSGEK